MSLESANQIRSNPPSSVESKRRTLIRSLDLIERVAILTLFAFFLNRMAVAFYHTGNMGNLILLITESILVGFILCRKKAADLSLRLSDWFLAFSATSLPLMAMPSTANTHYGWEGFAILMSFLGLFIQVTSKFTLGRRFGVVAANRGLCMSGPYRLVRHPIYMGYLFAHIGFCLLNPIVWNLMLFGTLYALKIPRILAEERLLKQDPAYQNYCSIVRYRLIPGVF